MVKSVRWQKEQLHVVKVGFLSVCFLKSIPDVCMKSPFYRPSNHRSFAGLIDVIVNSGVILRWDIRMSVQPHVRGLPRNIYDFVCLSPLGILPGRLPRSSAFNALNYPFDSHSMRGFCVPFDRHDTSSLNKSALAAFRSVHPF